MKELLHDVRTSEGWLVAVFLKRNVQRFDPELVETKSFLKRSHLGSRLVVIGMLAFLGCTLHAATHESLSTECEVWVDDAPT